MRKILTFILLLCAFSAGAQNFSGTFEQVKTLKVSGKTIKSAGDITFTAPDQLAMLYTKPDGDFFIIDGDFIRMDMRGVQADVDTKTNKTVALQRNALIYSCTGQYEKIAQEMDATCTVTPGKNGGKHVELKVKKASPKGYSGVVLEYNKAGIVQKLTLEEFGGITTDYILNVK
ncbi:MAG: outer membrane lipoprotein carrier protein LolA [Bacteroidales bacterium]|nr:outer membrane lipoprotein carrier protein LolA [Bacteroidales bacterium]